MTPKLILVVFFFQFAMRFGNWWSSGLPDAGGLHMELHRYASCTLLLQPHLEEVRNTTMAG